VTTNPYLVLLKRSFPPGVRVTTFSWPAALFGRYDVLHVHWPEVVADRRNPVRSLAASALFALVLVRCRVMRRAVVRTAHNVAPHERRRPWVTSVVRLCDRWTTWWIRLNASTPCPEPATSILHGHYRDWYRVCDEPAEPGRILTFGLLRPYKGLEALVTAFGEITDDAVRLQVAGRPSTEALGELVRQAAHRDPRIGHRLEHVPDDALAAELARAQLVVLPYHEMHNSGAVLLSLSLGRPVLVPRNEVTDALADEVGSWWVQRYDGELTAQDLRAGLAAVSGPPPEPVDLTARQWPAIGERHAEVFLDAVRRARTRRSSSSENGGSPGHLRIAMIGTRGVPARYGGFETAVEEVGSRLAARGHDVTVYCRAAEGDRRPDTYAGMRLVHRPALRHRALETLSHTALSVLHVVTHRVDAAVVFNAANAPLLPVLRAARIPVATHVDGLEWQRAKWGRTGRRYYRVAESLAVRWSDGLIADARGIAEYYRAQFGAPTREISYGAPIVQAAGDRLAELGLGPRGYHLVVARFEPENHVDLVVAGYVRSSARLPLVVVGSAPYAQRYTDLVHEAADERVRFLGAVWDAELIDQLFSGAATYLHGHSVGGTNPALLRAIGAGAPTAAFDVTFNREVLGDAGRYFTDEAEVAAVVEEAESDPGGAEARGAALRERARGYDWDDVATRYETLMTDLATRRLRRPGLSGRRRPTARAGEAS
jgi:glycosyltransferase involved in cell wall biosynthesis